MGTTENYVVPHEPKDIAGRMCIVTLPDGLVPLAACMNREAAERIAYLINRYGLVG